MNLLEILRSMVGTNLWSPMMGQCTLIGVYENSFEVKKWDYVYRFLPDGRYNKDGEVMIFPSKENRDWTTFYHRNKPAINALLDLVDTNKLISFLKKNLKVGDKVKTYDSLVKNSTYGILKFSGVYANNPISEICEYLGEPIYEIDFSDQFYSTEMLNISYILYNNPRLVYLVEQNLDSLKKESKFDPHTLKPFDRVLVRDYDTTIWEIDFFQKYLGTDSECLNACWKQCIPYNAETQHLVNTENKPLKKYIYW